MERALCIFIVMEMLVVNLSTVDLCSHRTFSGRRTLCILMMFTAVLTAITHNWWAPMGFLQGNALFAVIGIVYLIPLSFLYSDPPLRMSGILFSAWIYTLLVYCLSVRVANLLPDEVFLRHVAVVQSMIYAVTLYPFIHWIKRGFLFVLRTITKPNLYLLQAVSLCWFGTIILVNGLLVYPYHSPLQMAVMVAIAVDALLSYRLIVSMFVSLGEVKSLQEIVYLDPLTGIYNREKLFVDGEALVRRKKAFRLVFMDLNHFKTVNDQFGHQAGDRYLTAYAQTTKGFLREGETVYRISGDEFVILSQHPDSEAMLEKLHHYPSRLENLEFLGCSIGWADYPREAASLDTLIALADQRMYRQKHGNRSGGPAESGGTPDGDNRN